MVTVIPAPWSQGADRTQTCFDVTTDDSYGDDWNGSALSIYVDGVMVGSGLRTVHTLCLDCTRQTAGTFYNTGSGAPETIADAFCVTAGQSVTIEYAKDNYDFENSFTVVSTSGETLYSGNGADGEGILWDNEFGGFYIANSDDCNDTEPLAWTGATEVCDGVDNDCDGDADSSAIDQLTWYEDLDADGYGDPLSIWTICDQPSGYVDNDGDCNDEEPFAWTGATEVCDGVDNNCIDGRLDSIDPLDWYLDADQDGYGDANNMGSICDTNTIATCFDVAMDDELATGGIIGALSIYIDGMMVDSGHQTDRQVHVLIVRFQTAGTFYNTGLFFSEVITDAFCVTAGQVVTVEYAQDNWDSEK